MSIHEFDKNKKPDSEFISGHIKYLVPENKCRLLDGRRTNGYIEKYFEDSAMFRWRITKFEDKGKFWDLPAEDIKLFQFEKDSLILNESQVKLIINKIQTYQQVLNIEINMEIQKETNIEIDRKKEEIIKWVNKNAVFFKKNHKIDFTSCEGSKMLATDLKHYMESVHLLKEEKYTSETMVLNPNSGEWIKGMKIVLAEMGLASYQGKIPRTKDIFEGLGSKENRRKYLIHRLAFIRAYYHLLNIHEVVLYRGMSSESKWKEIFRTFLPCTFNLEVAKSFSDFNNPQYQSVYLVKMTVPVEKLFMTYFETEEMNRQYKESEAILLYDNNLKL